MTRQRDPDRMLAAALYGEARKLATDAGSIADAQQVLRELAAGRYDLLTMEAGRAAGAWIVSARRTMPVELLAAGLLVTVGPIDFAELERWIREGQRRASAPVHRAPALPRQGGSATARVAFNRSAGDGRGRAVRCEAISPEGEGVSLAAVQPSFLVGVGCRCGPDPADCLPDDMVVNNLTEKRGEFRDAPRDWKERAISVHGGEQSVEELYARVTGRRLDPARQPEQRARVATVGRLREAGFAVVHTPGRATPYHASVVWPADSWRTRQEVPWPEVVQKRFASCFNVEDS